MLHAGACVVLLVLVDSSLSLVNNSMIEARSALGDIKDKEIRKITGIRRAHVAKIKVKSTSSESGDNLGKSLKSGQNEADDESLGLTFSDSSEIKEKQKRNNKHIPRSTEERHGWKKWHRKCTPCPEDMKMKWKDPRIMWICGAFQRARRTFKSLCMMHYRNCQDGTMFVKIHDHRCQSSKYHPIGDHFFYDYPVKLPLDSNNEDSSSSALAD